VGAKQSNSQFRTHLHIQQSRARALKLARQLQPVEMENSTDFKNAFLATAIQITIRSLAVHSNLETNHHQRTLENYPHRHYQVTLQETPTLASHLGSLGYIAAASNLQLDTVEALITIVNTFYLEHSIDIKEFPKAQYKSMQAVLGFVEAQDYIAHLETLLIRAVQNQHPLLIAYGISAEDCVGLYNKLLYGTFSENLPIVIEYFQTLSNLLGGELPTLEPNYIYKLLRKTYAFGYSAGPRLFWHAALVNNILKLYKATPDNVPLNQTLTANSLEYLAAATDAFYMLYKHNLTDYVEPYYLRYKALTRGWLAALNYKVPAEARFTEDNYLSYIPSIASVNPPGGLKVLLSTNSRSVNNYIDIKLLILTRDYLEVALSIEPLESSAVEFIQRLIRVDINNLEFQMALDGYGEGIIVVKDLAGEVISNTLVFENNPTDLRP